MKKWTTVVASLLLAGSLIAQNYEDVLRTSEVFPRGNAQFMAMSGAMGVFGNNMSAVSVNPAAFLTATLATTKQETSRLGGDISAMNGNGLRRYAVELTPAFSYIKTKNYFPGYYEGGHVRGFYKHRVSTALRLPNMGFMVAQNTPNAGVLSGVSYGFTMNNQNIFDAAIRYETPSSTSSLTDAALVNAELFGVNYERVESFQDLFWHSYLLHKDNVGWFTDFTEDSPPTYGQRQTAIITRSGGRNEYVLNFGMDFSRYVYVGANLSIQNLNYSRQFVLEERDESNLLPILNNFMYRENVDVEGSGLMGKFGVIVRPIEFVRVGFAYHTPTTFFLTEEFSQSVNAQFDQNAGGKGQNIMTGSADSFNSYNYTISTPDRVLASLGCTITNMITIGVDYESVNYAKGYINTRNSDFAYTNENTDVMKNLKRANNVKIGAEFSYNMYSVRVGTALYGNPYVNSNNDDGLYRSDISAGIGMRTESGFYCDLACVKSTYKQENILYTDLHNNAVRGISRIKNTDCSLTFGFRF